jgi:hypothetical protein
MKLSIIEHVSKLLPDTELSPGISFFWSPKQNRITYNKDLVDQEIGIWSLLHESAHATLKHTSYGSDLGLLKLEVEAWEKAKELAIEYSIKIDDEHIQDCLDTYRDWLHRRSSCPNCNIICVQSSATKYSCHNCHTSWHVSASRFCRPYRLQVNNDQNKKSQKLIATFH